MVALLSRVLQRVFCLFVCFSATIVYATSGNFYAVFMAPFMLSDGMPVFDVQELISPVTTIQ